MQNKYRAYAKIHGMSRNGDKPKTYWREVPSIDGTQEIDNDCIDMVRHFANDFYRCESICLVLYPYTCGGQINLNMPITFRL